MITDVTARCRLPSADSLSLLVPPTRRSALGDRAFPVAASWAWNTLPSSVRTAASLPVFPRDLKTLLFHCRSIYHLCPFFKLCLTVSSSGFIDLQAGARSTDYAKCCRNFSLSITLILSFVILAAILVKLEILRILHYSLKISVMLAVYSLYAYTFKAYNILVKFP